MSRVVNFTFIVLSSEDGLNDLSMSIGSTRYSPDSVRTRYRTTYSQFLNIVASSPVGHDDTTITSFDIPCNLCPVVASLIFAGICIILQRNSTFFDEVLERLMEILGEHCSGSSLNFRLLISFDNLFLNCSRLDWRCLWS